MDDGGALRVQGGDEGVDERPPDWLELSALGRVQRPVSA